MAEEKRGYVILRGDGLLLHTKPVTEGEALWLSSSAYNKLKNRRARIKYLAEWGNVLNVSGYLRQMRRLGLSSYLAGLTGVYYSPEDFMERATWLLSYEGLQPQARQVLEGFVSNVRKFLRRPVKPRPLGGSPVVRYLEMGHPHLVRDDRARTVPVADWFAYAVDPSLNLYGVSVFPDAFWLWEQYGIFVRAVVVRRDVSKEDLIVALAENYVVAEVFKEDANRFARFINENEDKMKGAGYGDVVDRAKVLIGTVALLTA